MMAAMVYKNTTTDGTNGTDRAWIRSESKMKYIAGFFQRLCIAVTLFAGTMALSPAGMADLKVDQLFSDNMVLQRDMDVKVFGMADPGAEVCVEFNGRKVAGKADAGGKWLITLKPMEASVGPLEMKVSSQANSFVFKNIAVGDVWVCSGQSLSLIHI